MDDNRSLAIEAIDPKYFAQCLNEAGLNFIEPKSVELAPIIIALGGGVGIAAIIKSIGFAIGKYFEGKKELAAAYKEVVHVVIDGATIEFSAENATGAADILARRLLPSSHSTK